MLPPDRRIEHRHGHSLAVGAAMCLLVCSGPSRAAAADETPPDTEQANEQPVDNESDAPEPEESILEVAEPVVITATRREQSIFDVAAFADVVSEKDISEAMYRSVPEALRDVPGVMIQKTSQGQGSPIIRGFTGFRNLFLIDGIRLNNSVFRDGPNQYWNTVDVYSVSRLEVVQGPSSVLYGSDAIGGTVNAITKGPSSYGDGFEFGGLGYYRVSSAERSHTLRGELSATWKDTFGVYGGGTYADFGDLEAGSGRKPETGYDELAGDFKAEYFFNPDTRLVLAHQSFDLDDVMRTHSTIFAEHFEGTTVGSDLQRELDQNRDLTYVQLHAERLGAFIETARFSLSYHSQDETEERIRSNGERNDQGFDVDTLGAWVQFETPSPIGLWTYGVEYYRDDVDSFRRDFNADGSLDAVRIQGPVADDATYDLIGVYVQDDLAITESLDLILGGRFTYARASADRVEDPQTGSEISIVEDFDSLTGSARFLYRIDEAEHWHLFGGISQGFRSPNLSDLTRFDSARSNEIETPSPGLEPEEFVSYEIGAKTRYDDFSAQATYFYTDIDDMIVRQPTGAIIDGLQEVTKRNSGDGHIYGIEIGTSWRFQPDLTAFGWFAWMEGNLDSFPTSAPVLVREPLSRVMPASGEIGLRWDAPKRNLWLEGVLMIAGDADRLSASDIADTQRIPPGGTPGYAVLSLRSGWRINRNLALNFVIDNVTDEDYRVHGSGVNEPGINFILGVGCTF